MLELKNTGRSRVVDALDGRIIKCFYGPKAQKRFENECRILRHLNLACCPFVPRLIDAKRSRLSVVTQYAGKNVEQLPDNFVQELFDRLLEYGVLHRDPALRNVLYDSARKQFTLIDFELAEVGDLCGMPSQG
ncbi:MAG: phosphotransferase [Pirellulaceae bacterium]|nr:phosphotransferase [Pirellulaceae bacterium]